MAEQVGLVAQGSQVADGVAAVGEHDHQVAQHLATVVGAAANASVGPATKLSCQPQPVRQLAEQRGADMVTDPLAVGDDFEPGTGVGSLHLQGDPPGWDCGRQTAASSLVGRVPCYRVQFVRQPTKYAG
jgi:hypothetical protein